jgi:transposase
VRRKGRSIRDVAESLGVSEQSLRGWLKRTQLDAGERHDGLSTDQREEFRRLKAENRRLRQEREILKRAAAFFARETETSRGGTHPRP